MHGKKMHIHTTRKANGVEYHYFRPPKKLNLICDGMIPLGKDREKAEELAKIYSAGAIPGEYLTIDEAVGQRHVRKLIRNSKSRAAKKGLEFNISFDLIYDMIKRNGDRCELTGSRFDYHAGKRRGRNPFSPSIDRIDPLKGYTPDNVRVVCTAMNYALSDWGDEVFERLAAGYLEQIGYKKLKYR